MSKHTPGPWKVGDRHYVLPTITSDTDSYICLLGGENETRSGNARLIAAAPDLLRCCEASLTYLLLEEHLDKIQLIDELKRIIAKVEGNLQ